MIVQLSHDKMSVIDETTFRQMFYSSFLSHACTKVLEKNLLNGEEIIQSDSKAIYIVVQAIHPHLFLALG